MEAGLQMASSDMVFILVIVGDKPEYVYNNSVYI